MGKLSHRSVHRKVCSGTKSGPNPCQERFVRTDVPASPLKIESVCMSKKSALPTKHTPVQKVQNKLYHFCAMRSGFPLGLLPV